MTLDPVRRAMRAKEIMEDPMVVEAFATASDTIMKAWRKDTNADNREAYWRQLQALDRVHASLQRAMADGKYDAAMKEDAAGRA